MTLTKSLSESPSHGLGQYPGDDVTVHYNEDIFVGYRYFDSYKVEPQFAFGHGLSYTSFQYTDLNPGETKTVTINLDKEAFQYYNDILQK